MMASFIVRLFEKFSIQRDGQTIDGFQARKVQELFSYLLLSRNHPQPRELLAEILWGNQPSTKSSKCLRQTLWRLRSFLMNDESLSEPVLLIDNNWIQLNLPSDFWLDTAEFERISNYVNEKPIQKLNARDLKMMQYAADIYKGDLLEGWYQDWCIFERERFQIAHLMLLDKLVQYCELHQKYEAGLAYGMEILRQDHAYERTHRQLMRLYFMTGNRTQALHQYEYCVMALRNELGVEPSERTKQLHEQIRLDTFRPSQFVGEKVVSDATIGATPALQDVLNRLEEVSETLSRLKYQIQEEICSLDSALSHLR